MKNRAGGFTLLETIVSVGIFSLLIVFIFYAFSMVTSIFQDTDVRQSVENQMKGVKALLQRDIEMSDFWFTNSISRVQPDTTFRDALAVGTLSDWTNPAQFDGVTGRPIWNRYFVWYATQETPGRLIRQIVEPGGTLPGPYASLSTNLNEGDPNANADVLLTRTLSAGVRDFEVNPRLQNGTVSISIQLEGRGAKRANSQENTVDTLGLELIVRPRNTWPEI